MRPKRSACLGVCLIAACALTRALASEAAAYEPVKPLPPKPEWSRFVMLLWQYQTDAAKDKALYESVNLHGFHIDHSYSDARIRFAKESGWPFYIDHAAGKGYLYLNKGSLNQIAKKKGIQVRPNSLADPATIEAMHKLLKDHITRAEGAPAVAYAFDDEISLYTFASPSDVDGHPNNIAGFRKWLATQYKSIADLNAEWGTTFGSFDEVRPKGFDEVRQAAAAPLPSWNLAPWADFRSYMDIHFSAVLAELTRYANSLDPKTPAGFVGGQQPSPWGGYDYNRLADAVQWMEAYDIGGSNEILRSFWGQEKPHVQTFFSSGDPKVDTWFLWYYLCHGNRCVICWPEGWFKGGKVADHIQKCADVYKEVQSDLSKKIIDGTFLHDPVAIYYSHPSIQISWALDATVHGGTWINRSSSLDNDNSVAGNNRVIWLKLLEDLGYQGKFVRQGDLLEGKLYEKGFRVLLLADVLATSAGEAQAVRAFAEAGGTVLADYGNGLFDEHGKGRAEGVLDKLFGIKQNPAQGVLGGKEVTEIDGEKYGEKDFRKRLTTANALRHKGMVVYGRGVECVDGKADAAVSGAAAVVRKAAGKGQAIFLNLSPIEYLFGRTSETGAPWRELVGGILKDAGLTPRVVLQENGKPAAESEALLWKSGDRTVLCVVKNPIRRASVEGAGKTDLSKLEPVKLGLAFDRDVKDLVNERTGAKLGDGNAFSDDWKPWEANIYSFSR